MSLQKLVLESRHNALLFIIGFISASLTFGSAVTAHESLSFFVTSGILIGIMTIVLGFTRCIFLQQYFAKIFAEQKRNDATLNKIKCITIFSLLELYVYLAVSIVLLYFAMTYKRIDTYLIVLESNLVLNIITVLLNFLGQLSIYSDISMRESDIKPEYKLPWLGPIKQSINIPVVGQAPILSGDIESIGRPEFYSRIA